MRQIGLGPIKNHVNQMTRLTDLELYIKLRTSMDVGAVYIDLARPQKIQNVAR